jgi:hypothetical protein
VLPWIAPACVVIIFILQFFPWVGVYPGGVPMIWANAWAAAFAGGSSDADLEATPIVGEALTKPIKPGDPKPPGPPANPLAGASVLAIFYLLLFLLVGLPVSIASVVLDRVPVKLPPGIQQSMPWRFGIVAAASLILFLFLALQLILGFGLENRYADWVQNNVGNAEARKSNDLKVRDAERGMALDALHYTAWLTLAVILHLVAIFSSLLMFWLDRRGGTRATPRLELLW